MADVGSGDSPAGGDGGGGDDPVVGADIQAAGSEMSPEPGMGAGRDQVERKRRERGENGLDERLAPRPVLRSGAVHAVQQFGGGDGGDASRLGGTELLGQPASTSVMA